MKKEGREVLISVGCPKSIFGVGVWNLATPVQSDHARLEHAIYGQISQGRHGPEPSTAGQTLARSSPPKSIINNIIIQLTQNYQSIRDISCE